MRPTHVHVFVFSPHRVQQLYIHSTQDGKMATIMYCGTVTEGKDARPKMKDKSS